jgi:hypothetical protein
LTGGTIAISTNFVEGGLSGATLDGSGFLAGGSSVSAFTRPAELDFWPPLGSILIGKADAGLAPAIDFNERPRVSPFDVGGYETNGLTTNPGWKVGPGFKQSGPGDFVPHWRQPICVYSDLAAEHRSADDVGFSVEHGLVAELRKHREAGGVVDLVVQLSSETAALSLAMPSAVPMLKIDRTVTMRFMTPPSPAVRVV